MMMRTMVLMTLVLRPKMTRSTSPEVSVYCIYKVQLHLLAFQFLEMYHWFLHFSTILDSYSKDGQEALCSPSWKHCEIPLPCHREPSSHHSLAKEWQRIQRRAPNRRHQGERLIFLFVGDIAMTWTFQNLTINISTASCLHITILCS